MISKFFAVVIVLVGVVLGAYVGAWVLFVGGIVQAVEGFKATPVEARDVGIGALKVVCAGIGGWLVFWACFAVAAVLWGDGDNRPNPRGKLSARQVERDWERTTRQ